MEVLVWFYAKLVLGIVISATALAVIFYLVLKGRGKASLSLVPVMLIGVWLLSGGKIKVGSIEAQAEDFSTDIPTNGRFQTIDGQRHHHTRQWMLPIARSVRCVLRRWE